MESAAERKNKRPMRILLVNPHEYTFSSFHNINTYPMGLYNLATYYRNRGDYVEVLDMYPELTFSDSVSTGPEGLMYDGHKVVNEVKTSMRCGNWESERIEKGVLRVGLPNSIFIDKIKNGNFDVIGVTCTFTYAYKSAFEIMGLIKHHSARSIITFGGPYVRLCSDHAKQSVADVLVDSRNNAIDFIDTDMSLFNRPPHRVNLLTALGCRNRCKYCAVTFLEGNSRQEKDPVKVFKFIEKCYALGHTRFRFLDSDLLGNFDNHLGMILELIISSGMKISLSSYGGVEAAILTDRQASMMSNAGFTELVIPLENSDDKVLEGWGRKTFRNKWTEAAVIANSYFNKVSSYIMVGYPGQTVDNVMQSVDLCKNNNVTPGLLPFTPIPNTAYKDDRDLESLHPLLWPYAWDGLKVKDLESIFSTYESKWFNSDYFTTEFKNKNKVETVRIFETSKPILRRVIDNEMSRVW